MIAFESRGARSIGYDPVFLTLDQVSKAAAELASATDAELASATENSSEPPRGQVACDPASAV